MARESYCKLMPFQASTGSKHGELLGAHFFQAGTCVELLADLTSSELHAPRRQVGARTPRAARLVVGARRAYASVCDDASPSTCGSAQLGDPQLGFCVGRQHSPSATG